MEDEPSPGSVIDGPGCGNGSGVGGSWWDDPFGREIGDVFGLVDLDFWVAFWMPLVTGEISEPENVLEGGVSPTIDAGLSLPLAFTPFNGVSFEGVVDGENVFPLELKLPTLDGRDGGLIMGVRVADKFLECRFDC